MAFHLTTPFAILQNSRSGHSFSPTPSAERARSFSFSNGTSPFPVDDNGCRACSPFLEDSLQPNFFPPPYSALMSASIGSSPSPYIWISRSWTPEQYLFLPNPLYHVLPPWNWLLFCSPLSEPPFHASCSQVDSFFLSSRDRHFFALMFFFGPPPRKPCPPVLHSGS